MTSKIVKATYCVEEGFKIPIHINLEDKAQVESWGVRWNRLHIYLVDGSVVKISPMGWVDNFDYKHPTDTEIVDNEEEEEEEEKADN